MVIYIYFTYYSGSRGSARSRHIHRTDASISLRVERIDESEQRYEEHGRVIPWSADSAPLVSGAEGSYGSTRTNPASYQQSVGTEPAIWTSFLVNKY